MEQQKIIDFPSRQRYNDDNITGDFVLFKELSQLNSPFVPPDLLNDLFLTNDLTKKYSIDEITAAKQEVTSTDESQKTNEVSNMEITPKEYIDDRISSLEKSMDDKFIAHEKLLFEKIDHLHTKFEGSLDTKLNSFKTQINNEQKESRRFLIGTILASLGITTAIIIGVLGFVIK